MHITKLELEDIKSYENAVFEFQRGTTAITGANGAGKTTIIEAIAWVLFDLLDYKKDDFVRRGAKKGAVDVTFESGLDERRYLVHRDTGTAYYVYDPELKLRIADKKEEVARFLWAHLGVEPGTDLESLFRRAIGVPQGTFTAIFLETTTERKKAFDKLLKVEEYRQSSEKLRETSRYLEALIATVREKIARAEGELVRFDRISEENDILTAQLKERSDEVKLLSSEAAERSEKVAVFEKIASRINELKAEADRLDAGKVRLEIHLTQKERERNQCLAASDKIKLVEADYHTYLRSVARLRELERERADRDKLRVEMARVETAQINVRADQKRFQDNLASAEHARGAVSALTPKVAEQERLEKQREILRINLANIKAREDQIGSLDEKINRLRESYKANQAQIKEAETKRELAAEIEELRKREIDLTNSLAGLRARLETDRKFQAEIKNGLCPILSQRCLNLKEGETLEGFVTSQFSDMTGQIIAIETEQRSLSITLKTSREAEIVAATLDNLRTREREISEDGKRLKTEKESLEKDMGAVEDVRKELVDVEAKLKALDNPKAKLIAFETEAARETNILENITRIESNLERLESERRIFVEKLEMYKDLDTNWAQAAADRERTADAHREFLINETLAKDLPVREQELEKAIAEMTGLVETVEKAVNEYDAAGKEYDQSAHLSERSVLLNVEKNLTEARVHAANIEVQQDRAAAEIERLKRVKTSMQGEFQEKDRLEKIWEATDFIRATLKEAAPRVARNYVYHVSLEANQMYREIMGNAERTLKWTEDYGIYLEENGYERPFVNLSGGEQMAAALSVRLALLKQLSDVRLAFFDEPTTNMDVERRERLAEQISRITENRTFDQLFIISHDDTFEGFADNVVSIGLA